MIVAALRCAGPHPIVLPPVSGPIEGNTMKLVNQKRTGLLPEHHGIAPITREVRATIPVIEALRAAGATVDPISMADMPVYRVTLGATMPAGIVACHVNGPPYVDTCLRLACEPEYPGEWDGQSYWQQVDFTPCPVCGAPVVWYEAGYVPGYRVCSQPPHHHSLAGEVRNG